MKMTILMAFAFAFALGISPAALADNVEAGAEKSLTCQACHGPDGLGTNPMYPVLAGQYEDYLAQALRAYRDGSRKNAIMMGLAAPLSDEDIDDLAAYYASLPGGLKTLPKR
jgi:cytochrome c553